MASTTWLDAEPAAEAQDFDGPGEHHLAILKQGEVPGPDLKTILRP